MGSRGVIAAALAVASGVVCVAADSGRAAGASDPSLLFFTGTDLWRYGAFLYGGTLWSPGGLDTDGFTLKTLVDGGDYSYFSGDLHAGIDGKMLSAAVLPGWRMSRDGLIVSVFVGPVVQDYRLAPNDPGATLHGFYAGAQVAADIWYQPSATTMAAVSGAIASIGPTGSLRMAFGYKFLEPVFFGPETQEIWSGDFQEVQFGAHLTGLHTAALEWSAGSGWSITTDHRSGPYLRLGVSARY
jgi:hypothetical protein